MTKKGTPHERGRKDRDYRPGFIPLTKAMEDAVYNWRCDFSKGRRTVKMLDTKICGEHEGKAGFSSALQARKHRRRPSIRRDWWMKFCNIAQIKGLPFIVKPQAVKEDKQATRWIEVTMPRRWYFEISLITANRFGLITVLSEFSGSTPESDARDAAVKWSEALECEWDDLTPNGLGKNVKHHPKTVDTSESGVYNSSMTGLR